MSVAFKDPDDVNSEPSLQCFKRLATEMVCYILGMDMQSIKMSVPQCISRSGGTRFSFFKRLKVRIEK